MTTEARGSLLFVANFPANTGYAWDTIEGLFARLADRVATQGVRTFVSYPSIPTPPRALTGSAAEPVVLDASLASEASVLAVEKFIRAEAVRVLYLTDRPARSATYARLRRAGLKRIIVHARTSGGEMRPTGLRRAAKWFAVRIPGHAADMVVAVSDYVARRRVAVSLIPAARVIRIWNGLPVPPLDPRARERLCKLLPGVDGGRPIIACASRASPEKGVDCLLRAFDLLRRGYRGGAPPVLVYIGDGPALGGYWAAREQMESSEDIFLTGYQPAAASLLAGADICVVPSVGPEAFGLTVLEAMGQARPVIGSAVGGIPEVIEDGVSGVLVPPADPAALAGALKRLLADSELRKRLGVAARKRASELFTVDAQVTAIVKLVEDGLAGTQPEARIG